MTRHGIKSITWLCALAVVQCQALPALQLEFAVASVKPHPLPGIVGIVPGTRPQNFTSYGTRFADHVVTIQQLIMQAFDLQDYEVLGLPNWAKLVWGAPGGEYYDIDARAPNGDPTVAELRIMLQSLLVERCRLSFHRETKQLPVYALVITKGGLKAKKVPAGPQYSTMYSLIQRISLFVDRPIVDHTELPDWYDFAPLDLREAGREGPLGAAPVVSAEVEDKLGLKLEARREAIPVLVVDHVERPSPN